jgi:hypothetical protein
MYAAEHGNCPTQQEKLEAQAAQQLQLQQAAQEEARKASEYAADLEQRLAAAQQQLAQEREAAQERARNLEASTHLPPQSATGQSHVHCTASLVAKRVDAPGLRAAQDHDVGTHALATAQ